MQRDGKRRRKIEREVYVIWAAAHHCDTEGEDVVVCRQQLCKRAVCIELDPARLANSNQNPGHGQDLYMRHMGVSTDIYMNQERSKTTHHGLSKLV